MASSSQIQKSQSPTTSNSTQNIEIPIQNLIRIRDRRRKWKRYLISTDPQSENASWRTKFMFFLESTSVHIAIIILLLADISITVLELSSSLLPSDTNNGETGDQIWYHWVGIGILALLCLKSVFILVCTRGSFFRRPGCVVDGVVVVVALLMEVFLEGKGGGLIVVVSLWRLVRVVETAFELSDEAVEAEIEWIVCEFEGLREENSKLLEMVKEKDEIIEKLREEMDQCRV